MPGVNGSTSTRDVTVPDPIFDQCPGVHTSEAMGQDDAFAESSGWRAENVSDGMVLFHGDDVEPQEIDPIQITDIAPTILHWVGHAVPTDMDGSPVTEIFAPGTEPAERAVETRRPLPALDEEGSRRELDEEAKDRLADIGYLE